jgi:uncharacterized integral membrane protein
MPKSLSLSPFFEDAKYPKLVLAIGAILLLLLQLGIFVAVYNQSGLKSRVWILDSSGRKIYESSGPALSAYEKMTFENNFGSLRDYTTQLESQTVPFNYRAWILLAVGMPLGLILMLFFMAQVWLILLNGSPKEETHREKQSGPTGFSTFLSVSRNFSIVGVGFMIVMSMLVLWLIPSILGDLAKSFFGAVKDYPLFFIGVSAFVGGLLVWVIYLRYRLSKQMLENQIEIEKFRIQRQLMLDQNPAPPLLTAGAESDETRTQFLQPGDH